MSQTPDISPDLVASIQVCQTLRIDRSTLSRWVKDGTAIPAMRLPGKRGAFLFTPTEVDRLIALQASKAGAA